MPCECIENKNLNKDKLSLESMQTLSIDEIINLYRQGYTLEESENFTNIRSLALSSPQFQYATAVQGVPSANKIRITWIWSNTGAYGYGQFKFYNYGTGAEIGAMPSSCYDPGPSQLYRLSTYDITYTTAPADISVRAYRCSSDTQQSCPAGTCSAPTESDREYAELLLSEWMATPSQPSTLNITPGNGSLTLSWSAVTNTPILGYHIVVKIGGTTVIDGYWSQNVGPITITGLTNEISHNVLVSAISASNVEGTAKTGPGTPSLPTPVLTSITVTPTTASINVGATQQLTAVCKDQNNVTMACPTLTWLSSDTTKATVSSSGLVTGVAAGSANITVGASGVTSNTSAITVTSPTPVLTTIAITPTTASINVGATQQLTAVCKDQNNVTMTCPTLTWVSSNTAKATVNSSGLVTGISAGSANITAGASGVTSNTSVITVSAPSQVLTAIVISPPSQSINVGSTIQLTVVCKDQNNVTMTCPTLTWLSSDTTKATVSSSGLVTGVAAGSANITAGASGVTSNTSVITVNAIVSVLTSIAISPPSQSINVGNTIQLTAVCKDQNNTTMTCPTLAWLSSNTAKATVSSSGLVTGVSAGSTNITASASGVTSNISAITVVAPSQILTTITISPPSQSINVGNTIQLTAVCKDQNNTTMTCPTLAWLSGNPVVATVNSSGLVAGVAEGTANVTVSASGITSNISVIAVSITPPTAGGGGAIVIAAAALIAAAIFMMKKPPTPPT